MIKINKGAVSLEYKSFVFPGGEVGVKLTDHPRFFSECSDCTVFAQLQNSKDFIELAMVKDALERAHDKGYVDHPKPKYNLFCQIFGLLRYWY